MIWTFRDTTRWIPRNYRLHLFNGLRSRLTRCYERSTWWWKAPELRDAFYEACQW